MVGGIPSPACYIPDAFPAALFLAWRHAGDFGAGVPYAVVGGYAVRAWVAQVDEAAVRTTRDVDVLVRREDFPAVRAAMVEAGFHHREHLGVQMFVETADGSARDAVHVVIAGDMVRPGAHEPNPDVEPVVRTPDFRKLDGGESRTRRRDCVSFRTLP